MKMLARLFAGFVLLGTASATPSPRKNVGHGSEAVLFFTYRHSEVQFPPGLRCAVPAFVFKNESDIETLRRSIEAEPVFDTIPLDFDWSSTMVEMDLDGASYFVDKNGAGIGPQGWFRADWDHLEQFMRKWLVDPRDVLNGGARNAHEGKDQPRKIAIPGHCLEQHKSTK